MTWYIAKRLLSLCLTLLLASLVIFLVLEIVPGDPARLMLGINASEDAVAALREQMGLNQPAALRYAHWLGGLATGDLGNSLTYSTSVAALIGERIWVSLPLALLALALSTAIAIPVGAFSASRRGSVADTSVMAATQFGIAIPNFWFALLLVYCFAVVLHWAPAGGFPGWKAGLCPGLKALILPSIALALPQAAILSRIARSAMIETLDEDYIRTARAKGLTRSQALWRHALRNAMIPVVTIMGLQFAFLLAGTIIIENVFYLPGLGRLVFQAITQHDLPVVQGTVLMLVAAVILTNFAVDLLYAMIDPRLRRQR